MKLLLKDKTKANIFMTIFRQLKSHVDVVNINFEENRLYMQGMDSGQVSLFELQLQKNWFDEYEATGEVLGLNCGVLHAVFNGMEADHELQLYTEEDGDVLFMNLTSDENGVFDKLYEISLIDLEQHMLSVPNTYWELDLQLKSQSFAKIIDQLTQFGDDIKLSCTEEKIELSTKGNNGCMSVQIAIDDVGEYSIEEGKAFESSFSSNYIHWITQFSKLSEDMDIHFKENSPIQMRYIIHEKDNYFRFFLAPKIDDL